MGVWEGEGAVAARGGVGVVGDEGDGGRAAAGDGAQEREDAEPVGRREGRGGLVGQEDGRAQRWRRFGEVQDGLFTCAVRNAIPFFI